MKSGRKDKVSWTGWKLWSSSRRTIRSMKLMKRHHQAWNRDWTAKIRQRNAQTISSPKSTKTTPLTKHRMSPSKRSSRHVSVLSAVWATSATHRVENSQCEKLKQKRRKSTTLRSYRSKNRLLCIRRRTRLHLRRPTTLLGSSILRSKCGIWMTTNGWSRRRYPTIRLRNSSCILNTLRSYKAFRDQTLKSFSSRKRKALTNHLCLWRRRRQRSKRKVWLSKQKTSRRRP